MSETISKQALGIAERAVKVIDVDKYQSITLETGENDYYHELRSKLDEIREANGLVYLYTMQRKETNDGYEYIYMVDGMPVGSEDASALGDKEDEIGEEIVKSFETKNKQTGELFITEEYGALISAVVPIKSSSGEIIGVLGADFDADNIYNQMNKNRTELLIITLSVLAISVILIYFATNSITKPLNKLSSSAEMIGKGDLTVDVTSNRRDEIGKLTNSFNHMLDDLRRVIKSIDHNSEKLRESTSVLLNDALKTKDSSKQIANKLDNIAENADAQYKNSEESVKVIEEMAQGVNQIAKSSLIATELSSNTLEEIETGNHIVNDLIDQMKQVSNSVNDSSSSIMNLKSDSEEIENIIKIIREISSQTNLLALNAAIEAARAGEAGKGFSVVASEVRKLAEQSEKSTESIQQIIDKINKNTNQTVNKMELVLTNVKKGMNAVEDTGLVFNNILKSVEGVNQQIQEVSATSEEMSAAAEEISASAIQTSSNSKEVANSIIEAANITKDQDLLISVISKSIEDLEHMSSEMKKLTEKFEL
jgi:methyl-accepting chemotaxis protein